MGSISFKTTIGFVHLQNSLIKFLGSFLASIVSSYILRKNLVILPYKLIDCMLNTRSSENELVQPIKEIKCFILRCRVRQFRLEYNVPAPNMAANQNRPLKDYAAPSQEEPYSSIAPPSSR